MSANRLEFDGLDDLRSALRQLPADMASQGASIVETTAARVGADVVRNYPSRTGTLQRRVRVDHGVSARSGVSAIVRSAAPHASLYEFGTEARRTGAGANRGRMPVGPESSRLIPQAIRARRRMTDELTALVRAAGFEVS